MISVSSVEIEVIGITIYHIIGLMNVSIREEGDIHHHLIVDHILETGDIVIVEIDHRGDLGIIEIKIEGGEDHTVHPVDPVDHIVRVKIIKVVRVVRVVRVEVEVEGVEVEVEVVQVVNLVEVNDIIPYIDIFIYYHYINQMI